MIKLTVMFQFGGRPYLEKIMPYYFETHKIIL